MQVLRLATLALLTVFAASGCRTAGGNGLARPAPPVAASGSTSAAEILAEHNRNAGRIQVLEAQPALTITVADPQGEPSSYSVDGRLTMERPRNFKLDISHTTTKVADIGSNETEYWFWVKDKTQKALYYCNYDEANTSPLAATFQPDWIVEALGLRVIPESEAAEITVKPGEAGTLVLTHRPHKSGTETYTRVTILDKATRQIREYQLRSGDQKTLLARAVVPEGYFTVTGPAASGTENVSIMLPKRLQLQWIQERLTLDATFRNAKINNPLNQSRREYLFVEPTLGRGYSRINLAERTPATAGPTTIHETRPAPPAGVRLREPTPIEGEDAARRDDRGKPIAFNGTESTVPSLTDKVVGERFPTAAEPPFLTPANAGWRAATAPGFDR
jgi:hypothetical protein